MFGLRLKQKEEVAKEQIEEEEEEEVEYGAVDFWLGQGA